MKIRTILGAAIVLMLAQGAAVAQIKSIEIVDRGIYTADLISSSRDKQGIKKNTSRNFKLAVSTTDVPMQIGVRFGFQYRIVGSPLDARVTLRKVVVYPSAGIVPAQTKQRIFRDDSKLTAVIGAVEYTGYRFDDPWELVPGEWALQLWNGDRKLVEQRFNVRPK